jgi:hypothetical protein
MKPNNIEVLKTIFLKIPNVSDSPDGSDILCVWGSGTQIQRTAGLAQKKTTEINISVVLVCGRINGLS